MNRALSRRHINFSKPLIKVDSAKIFFAEENKESDRLINTDNSIPNDDFKNRSTSTENPGHTRPDIFIPSVKKHDITIPVIKQPENSSNLALCPSEICHKKRVIQTHYIRASYVNAGPSPDIYEPTDVDLRFLKGLNMDIVKAFGDRNQIRLESFGKIIEIWESNTGENEVISLEAALVVAKGEYGAAVKDYVSQIYEYWKNLRKSYQRPLVRRYLKVVNNAENNPNTAFRKREPEESKRTTRRNQRGANSSNIEEIETLQADLDKAMGLLAHVRYREMLKLELCELSFLEFQKSLDLDPSVNEKLVQKYKESYDTEPYIKMKEKIKGLFDKYKPGSVDKGEISGSEAISDTQNTQDSDSNFDVASFIASVVDESLTKTITPNAIKNLIKIELPRTDMIKIPPEPVRNTNNRNDSVVRPPLVWPVHKIMKPEPMEEEVVPDYIVRKRIGRQNRILIERVRNEDKDNWFLHNRSYYNEYSKRESLKMEDQDKLLIGTVSDEDKDGLLLPKRSYYNEHSQQEYKQIDPEVAQIIENANLRDLYIEKFQKFKDICASEQLEEENEAELSKDSMKDYGLSFKKFLKQKRSLNGL